jgi:replicative DNA helicase
MAQKNVSAGKVPPQNLDAEKSLIGAVLIDEEVLADVSEQVTPDDFYEKRHSLIFGGMMRLYEKHKPVDLLTLTDELKKKDELEIVERTHELRTDCRPCRSLRRTCCDRSCAPTAY